MSISPTRYTLSHNQSGRICDTFRGGVRDKSHERCRTNLIFQMRNCLSIEQLIRWMPVFQETYVNERKAGLYSWYSTTSPKDRVMVPFLPWRVKGSPRQHSFLYQAMFTPHTCTRFLKNIFPLVLSSSILLPRRPFSISVKLFCTHAHNVQSNAGGVWFLVTFNCFSTFVLKYKRRVIAHLWD